MAFDIRSRQLDELDAVCAVFGIDNSISDINQHDVEFVREIIQSCSSGVLDDDSLPIFSFCINVKDGDASHSIRIEMPRLYPELAALQVSVSCDVLTRVENASLSDVVNQYAESLLGEEAVILIFQKTRELIDEWLLDRNEKDVGSLEEELEFLQLREAIRDSAEVVLGRRMIWSHHIKSLIKRKLIIEWALELNLGGYSKPGYPGFIIIEGDEEDAKEYVRRIQRLRWKALVVRGEEQIEIPTGKCLDDMRKLHRGFQELDEGAASELGERCRAAGLEELFLTSMKIYRK